MLAREMVQLAGLPQRLMYNVRETCKYSGLTEGLIRDEVSAKRLKAMRPRGRERGTFIRPEDLDEWLERCMDEQD